MMQPSLFDAPVYPATPGHQNTATSRSAAAAAKDRAPTLRESVLLLLKSSALTADECAERLGVTVLACRPRLTELKVMGKIYDSGLTRKNASGVSASVWRAA